MFKVIIPLNDGVYKYKFILNNYNLKYNDEALYEDSNNI